VHVFLKQGERQLKRHTCWRKIRSSKSGIGQLKRSLKQPRRKREIAWEDGGTLGEGKGQASGKSDEGEKGGQQVGLRSINEKQSEARKCSQGPSLGISIHTLHQGSSHRKGGMLKVAGSAGLRGGGKGNCAGENLKIRRVIGGIAYPFTAGGSTR